LFYITGGAPQAVPGTACVEANRTACIEDTCSSDGIVFFLYQISNFSDRGISWYMLRKGVGVGCSESLTFNYLL
jgi:hypothetical protein